MVIQSNLIQPGEGFRCQQNGHALKDLIDWSDSSHSNSHCNFYGIPAAFLFSLYFVQLFVLHQWHSRMAQEFNFCDFMMHLCNNTETDKFGHQSL